MRLARGKRGGLLTDERTDDAANALLLAALAKAARIFSDRRYLAAAEELADKLAASDRAARAAMLFALTELYAADFSPARILAAAEIAKTLDIRPYRADGRPSPENDRALSLAALGLDALWRLTEEEAWQSKSVAILLELGEHPERHGPESLNALCVSLGLERARRILCACPEEEPPAVLAALRARYAPDLTILLKTPERAEALAAASPWTAATPIGRETLFYPREKGKTGVPAGL